MKNIKHIRQNYNKVIQEQDSAETDRLTKLIRAGLFDVKKLSFLKRALNKDVSKLTTADRKVLMELLETLIDEVVNSPNVYSKVKQNVMAKEEYIEEAKKDDYLVKLDPRFSKSPKVLPAIIILKRKAMRVYPDNQVIGLYYSQTLDKYISIPFETNEKSFNVGLSEAVASKSDDDNKKKTPQQIRDEIRQKAKDRIMNKPVSDMSSRELSVARKLGTGQAIKSAMSGDTHKALGMIGGVLGSYLARKKTPNTQPQTPEAPAKPTSLSMSRGAAVAKDIAANPVKINTQPAAKPSAIMSRGAAVAKDIAANPSTPSPIPDSLVKGRGGRTKGAPLSQTSNAIRKRASRAVAASANKVASQHNVFETKQFAKEKFLRKLEEKRQSSCEIDEIAPVLALVGAAARVAAPAVGRALVGGARSLARGAGRVAKGAGRAVGRAAAGVADAALSGVSQDSSGGSSTPEEPPKYLSTEIPKKIEAKVSRPDAPVDTSVTRQRQDTTLNRRYMQQPANEDVMIQNLKSIVEQQSESTELNIDGKQIVINNTIAEKMLNVYDTLNTDNKNKMVKMLNESPESFKKVVNFAVRQ